MPTLRDQGLYKLQLQGLRDEFLGSDIWTPSELDRFKTSPPC